MKYFKFVIGFIVLLSNNILNAQLTIEQVEKSTRIAVKSEYTSDVNFQGRKVGASQYGANIGAELTTVSGFGVHYAADYWSGFSTVSGISQQSLGLNYDIKSVEWLDLGVGYEHWFLNSGNDTINTALTNYFTFDLVADADFVKPHLNAYYISGDDKAYGFELGVGAPINFIDNDTMKLSILPDITLMTGTDTRITNVLTKKRSAKGKVTTTSSSTSSSVFGLLNTELTLPITFRMPRFEISAAAHLALPHSLSASDIVSSAFVYYTLSVNYFIFVDSNFKNTKKEKKR